LFEKFINMLKVGNIHDEPLFYMHGCNNDIKVEYFKTHLHDHILTPNEPILLKVIYRSRSRG
jgi:hypothetical protein